LFFLLLCTLCSKFLWIVFVLRKTKQKQSRETWNIGYTRGRKTKQKQSRETWNIGYTRGRDNTMTRSKKRNNGHQNITQ
jgi:hypothetical protein